MVTHVTHPLHKPSYGRRMVVATTLAVLFVALVAGVAGDFLMLVTAGLGIGAWVASLISLLAERRSARRAVSPWAPGCEVPVERYLSLGGLIGGGVGFAVALLDTTLLT